MTDNSENKGRNVVLIVSLVINLFLIGSIVGAVGIRGHHQSRFDGDREFSPPKSFVSPRHLVRAAPYDVRHQMFKVARENWDNVRPYLENIGAEREKVYGLMRQDVLDPAALQAAVVDLAEAEKQAHIASSQTIIKMLQTLPIEQRRDVIDELVRHENNRHDRHKRRHDRFERPFERNMEDRRGEEDTSPADE